MGAPYLLGCLLVIAVILLYICSINYLQVHHSPSSWIALKLYPLLAQWTLQFLLQPKVDALWMELVRTTKRFDHLPCLKIIQANGARVFIVLLLSFRFLAWFYSLFFLFEFEAWYGVDDVLYFFWRPKWLSIFIKRWLIFFTVFAAVLVLLSILSTHTVLYIRSIGTCWHAVEEELLVSTIVAARWVLEVLLLGLASWILTIERLLLLIAVKVHLYTRIVLKMIQHVLYIAHDAREIEEVLRILISLWIPACASCLLLLSIRHLLHSRHTLLRSCRIRHVWIGAHGWDPTHELLEVWVILRNVWVHILVRVSLSIRSLIVLLIIEVLLLIELSIVPTLSMGTCVASWSLVLACIGLRSHAAAGLVLVGGSVSLRSILLLHLSPLVLVLLVVVLLLPLVHVLLSLGLIWTTSSLPVDLRVYHLKLLVHCIVFIIAVDAIFNFIVDLVSNDLFDYHFSAIVFLVVIFAIIIIVFNLSVESGASLLMSKSIESISGLNGSHLVNAI